MQKEDSRIMRSKRDLKNALLNLMTIKPFDKITVMDICNEAMINRMTFYNHFVDKKDLLNTLFYDIRKDIIEKHNELNKDITLQSDTVRFCTSIIVLIVEFYLENDKISKSFTSSNESLILEHIEKNANKIVQELMLKKENMEKNDTILTLSFFSGGLANMALTWYKHQDKISKEELYESMAMALKVALENSLILNDTIK